MCGRSFPTACDQRPFCLSTCHPWRNNLVPFPTPHFYSHLYRRLQPARAAGLIAADQAATAATFLAGRETTGARAPAELAESLYLYASSTASAICRPGNDPFLTSCLSDLSAPHRLRRLHPNQLAILLNSLVLLGAHPGEDWLLEVDTCCYCHPGPFDPASATAILHSLAALHTVGAVQKYPSGPTSTSTRPVSPSRSITGIQKGNADVCGASWDEEPEAPNAQSLSYVYRTTANCQIRKQQRSLKQHSHIGVNPGQLRGRSSVKQWIGGASRPVYAPSCMSSWTPISSFSSCSSRADATDTTAAAPFRFPQAVHLRLIQGSVRSYSYEQLATLLQSFRSLGMVVSDEVVLQVGNRMAALLLEMAPEQQKGALAGVLGGEAGAGVHAEA